MDPQTEQLAQVINLLVSFITGTGGSAIAAVPFIFGAIELLDGFLHLSSSTKRLLALVFSLLAPSAAYALLLALTHAEFNLLTLGVACVVGGGLAVKAHDELERRGWGQLPAPEQAQPAGGE